MTCARFAPLRYRDRSLMSLPPSRKGTQFDHRIRGREPEQGVQVALRYPFLYMMRFPGARVIQPCRLRASTCQIESPIAICCALSRRPDKGSVWWCDPTCPGTSDRRGIEKWARRSECQRCDIAAAMAPAIHHRVRLYYARRRTRSLLASAWHHVSPATSTRRARSDDGRLQCPGPWWQSRSGRVFFEDLANGKNIIFCARGSSLVRAALVEIAGSDGETYSLLIRAKAGRCCS